MEDATVLTEWRVVMEFTILFTVATLSCFSQLSQCYKEKEVNPQPSFKKPWNSEDYSEEDLTWGRYHTSLTFTRDEPLLNRKNLRSEKEFSSGEEVKVTPIQANRFTFLDTEVNSIENNWNISSLQDLSAYKHFIENHLIALTPCTSNLGQHPIINGDSRLALTGKAINSHEYCTSVDTCLGQIATSLPRTNSDKIPLLKSLIEFGTELIRPTCLYVEDEVLYNGICCKKIKPNHVQELSVDKEGIEKQTFKQASEVPLLRKPLIDRGHIFTRPSQSLENEDRGQDQSFINIRPISNPNNHFSQSFITHPPEITNKPWWVTKSTSTPRTEKTTKRKWWWFSTKRKPTSTSPSTTRVSTKWWQTRKTTKSKKWQKDTTSTSRFQTTTLKPIKNEDYCSPAAFKDAASDFDPQYDLSSLRITGGRPLTPHAFPWLVMIMRGRKHVCGGSLIDDTHILTAAHCVATLTSSQLSRLRILLGSHNIGREEDTRNEYTIKTVVRHKDYSRRLLRNDLAIITLNDTVKFTKEIRPICLYDGKSDLYNEYATVAGWGSLYEGGYQVYTPRVVDLRIWGNQECRTTYGNAAPGGIVKSYLCAGKQGKDACSGDSGGPLVKKMKGVWKQIGVVSWGIGCGKGHFPGVYSRITHFYPWIQRVLRNF